MLDQTKAEFLQIREWPSGAIYVYYVSRVLDDFLCRMCKKERPRAYRGTAGSSYTDSDFSQVTFTCDKCAWEESLKGKYTIYRIPLEDVSRYKFNFKMENEP